MLPPRLSPALAALLLLGTVGCAKQETPDPRIGTGRYTLDGRRVHCQARPVLDSTVIGGQRYRVLRIVLTETSQPAGAAPALTLTFQRPAAVPNALYAFSALTYAGGDPAPGTPYRVRPESTFSQTSTGHFSGTFAGSGPGASTIEDGFYANVRL
ncbi:hypothetical protein [Hymenobacter arizonensis]|uniref:Lipoprotein n=1 Tax=Hymenobacter arizonensis TaxID=1227077 RepID=A0A1I6BRC6_HYMAR|nr:hypothetical protein [Hymenobacter arizonensis]SFQ83486.1 hypothetical protein SAMN04515668_4978 [Hymenobacter arizonensis]